MRSRYGYAPVPKYTVAAIGVTTYTLNLNASSHCRAACPLAIMESACTYFQVVQVFQAFEWELRDKDVSKGAREARARVLFQILRQIRKDG